MQTESFESFYGYVESARDALILVEACRLNKLHTIKRRLNEQERSKIRSGSIFVFTEKESRIKRWTDGKLWSPSRIQGHFLVYREVADIQPPPKDINEYAHPMGLTRSSLSNNFDTSKGSGPLTSVKGTYFFKHNGLIKKTITVRLANSNYHVVFYHGMEMDQLTRPSQHVFFQSISVPSYALPQPQTLKRVGISFEESAPADPPNGLLALPSITNSLTNHQPPPPPFISPHNFLSQQRHRFSHLAATSHPTEFPLSPPTGPSAFSDNLIDLTNNAFSYPSPWNGQQSDPKYSALDIHQILSRDNSDDFFNGSTAKSQMFLHPLPTAPYLSAGVQPTPHPTIQKPNTPYGS